MKKYKDLLNELPSKSVVVTYGQFNPPTTGHELLIKVTKKLAKQRKADHIVFVSSKQDKKNPLEISKKIQYLELMFPSTRFVAAHDDVDCIGSLRKYKNVTMVSSADSVAAYKKLFARGNFEHTDFVPAGSTCPDSDDKVLKAAKIGYSSFKSSLPTSVRDLDAKRLFNDVRSGMGLEPIREQINLVKDDTREQYFRGEIFNEGDIVESNNTVYKIVKRGSNHLLLQDETGTKVSKWIQDVQLTEREFMEDKLLESVSVNPVDMANKEADKAKNDTAKAKLAAQQADAKARLAVNQKREMDNLKSTLQKEAAPVLVKTIMSLSDFRKNTTKTPEEKEIESKVKDGLVGNTHMGDVHGLRHMKVKHHLGEETEEQQDTRAAQLKRFKAQASEAKLDPVKEEVYKGLEKEDKPGKVKTAAVKTHPKAVGIDTVEGWKDEQKPVKEEFDDVNEEELENLTRLDLENLSEEDFFEAYEDEELAIIDEDTGEEIEAVSEEVDLDAPALMEVLSRIERVRAKARMRRSQAKRERREKIALRQLSTPQVANKRARRMAISAMKKRLLKGRNPQKVSVGEKESMERFIQQRRKIVDRLAARMVSRVKQVEKARMSHKKFTKNNGVAF